MRRAILAVAATTAIVVGLLHYKTSSAPRQFSVAAGAPQTSTPRPGSTAPTAAPSTPPASAPPPTSSTPSPAAASRTVTGPIVTTRFGDVQVAVSLSGQRLTDIRAPQLPYDRARSASISQYVAPVLRSEALAAQSAQIDTISGATYTSDAYAQSLQAALTQAGI
ncbi:MAG: hypothetical protein QOH66_666 [Actinomycetota bacterium]|jgi:uncharacterized protein with FMN-binding domain|nr:hypothetical protein [Actinomycetota bacterium]